MRALYQSARAVVLHATCEETCEAIGKQGADVVITDPPYTSHVHNNIRSVNTTGKVKVKKWAPGFDPLTKFEHVDLLLLTAKRWVLAFCALESFSDYRNAAGGDWQNGGCYVRSGIWRKQQAAPQLSGDRPANSCEGVAVMHAPVEGRMHWNGNGKHAFWRVEGEDVFAEHGRIRSEKVHPTQKPVPLMTQLVELFSDADEWILDPYCGAGSTGVAALQLGRRVILADADPKWAEHTARTIEALEAGGKAA